MGPNDADIIRVYPRTVNGLVSDSAFPINADIEIVVEVEAGSAIFNAGARFFVGLVVRDVSNFTPLPQPMPLPGSPALFTNDNLFATNWNTPSDKFVYKVPASSLANRQGHVLDVVAYLDVNVANPDMSFAQSEMFIITQP